MLSHNLAQCQETLKNCMASYPVGVSAKQEQVVMAPDVDQALLLWVKRMEEKWETINGPMLMVKRQHFKEEFGIPENHRLSGIGWIPGFFRAWGLKEYSLHGEVASVDLEQVAKEDSCIQKIASTYKKENILNLNETGLWPL
ncbi:hypothetical protein EST38_g12993 [Candolleomyces aberdarensis]|uniref:HTH CENPB-type domain-containing protein n=1 Tax=Candolleomyces aberdarensis TaxID=2316362 RepID=A0A4Q2D275_9AGAR|nr:hypothetical protein EST38_g12993 [Candolleomyces aberdarensis]